MSDFGEEIINRLPRRSSLHNKKHPMRKIIDGTIGEWLQNQEETDWFSQFFLTEATGKYLDVHGKNYGLLRKIDESDEEYRQRIIYESLGHLTVDFLRDVYCVDLYSYVDDFNVNMNTLVSDNPHLSSQGYLADADATVKHILNKKFVIGSEVTWL